MRRLSWQLVAAGAVAGCALTLGVQFATNHLKTVRTPPQEQRAPTKASLGISGDPAMGSTDAPITIVAFSDFECPYCKRFHDEVLPVLRKEYIDKGLVRLIHKDLPLPFHSNADQAARVARCSADDKEYWKIYSALFSKQECLSCLGPKQIAKDLLGSNNNRLEDCIHSKEVSAAITSNVSEAVLHGINGTPTFVIGLSQGNLLSGEVVVGARDWPEFRKKIENALRQTRSN